MNAGQRTNIGFGRVTRLMPCTNELHLCQGDYVLDLVCRYVWMLARILIFTKFYERVGLERVGLGRYLFLALSVTVSHVNGRYDMHVVTH